jgi:hypothetical protein
MAAVCAGLLLSGIPLSAAVAAPKCPEGRTATGACVNPGLALNARRSAVIFAQPKLSATAVPVLPSLDPLYRYPRELIFDPQRPTPVGPFRVLIGQNGPQVVFSP